MTLYYLECRRFNLFHRFSRGRRAPLANTYRLHCFYLPECFDVFVDLGIDPLDDCLLAICKPIDCHFVAEGRCPILDHDEAVENFVNYLTDRA